MHTVLLATRVSSDTIEHVSSSSLSISFDFVKVPFSILVKAASWKVEEDF